MFLNGNRIIKDMCAMLNAMDDNAKFDGNQMPIIEQLSNFIETHSRVLELSAIRFLLFSQISHLFFLTIFFFKFQGYFMEFSK